VRTIAAALTLGIGALILTVGMSSNTAANRDFICYWAAGKLLIHHGNPYDGPAILATQQAAGFTDGRPFFMRNPPIAFFITIPIAFFSERVAAILWSLAIMASMMTSIGLIWEMHGRPRDRLHLVGYLFPPAFACLLAGQIGMFLLLGVVLFLYWRDKHPFAAGAAILLCALKPHLFLPFAAVLIVWIFVTRSFRVLAGLATAVAAALAIGFLLDPHGWAHYAEMIRSSELQDEFIPTLSLMFRLLVHRSWIWLQFLPAFLATAWAVAYYWKKRHAWDWMKDGMLVLCLSVLVAPYAWFLDEAVLIPAILVSLYQASAVGRSLLPFACIAVLALVEVVAGVQVNSGLYLWTAPAWFAWFLYAMKSPALPEIRTEQAA
jgi:hypothetical protein